MPQEENLKTIEVLEIADLLDEEFRTKETALDPSMSRFFPMVYESIDFDWKNFFETKFLRSFNGLMINGLKPIRKVICVVFFNDEIIEKVLRESTEGILIFSHHPIQMECGDPRGQSGKGFLPVDPSLLVRLKDKGISVYTCHAPLDAGSVSGMGTNESIVKVINAKVITQYYPYGHGFAARVCELPQTMKISEIINVFKQRLDLPYVDLQGTKEKNVNKLVVLAGGGGSYSDIKSAEEYGVDCIITGEVTSKIIGDRGDRERLALNEYYKNTKISAIGLSHAGSEFLVMPEIANWIKTTFKIEANALSEERWWR